ncbi:hypothetical protein ABQG65_13950 [Yersinia alsatica]
MTAVIAGGAASGRLAVNILYGVPVTNPSQSYLSPLWWAFYFLQSGVSHA